MVDPDVADHQGGSGELGGHRPQHVPGFGSAIALPRRHYRRKADMLPTMGVPLRSAITWGRRRIRIFLYDSASTADLQVKGLRATRLRDTPLSLPLCLSVCLSGWSPTPTVTS